MRIDKFLKVARLIKRRTIAKEVLDASKVRVNDRVVKASYEVKVGDVIEINLSKINFKTKVKEIIQNPKGDEYLNMFENI